MLTRLMQRRARLVLAPWREEISESDNNLRLSRKFEIKATISDCPQKSLKTQENQIAVATFQL